MSYRRNRNKGYMLAAIGALLVAGYFTAPALASFARGALHTIGLPLWRGGAAVRSVSVSDMASSRASLIEENALLRDRLRELSPRLVFLEELRRENESLKELLGRSSPKDVVAAGVLARPPVSPYDSLVIDAGERDGVREGARVYAFGDAALGKIASVRAGTALVSLYSSPGNSFEALLETSDGEFASVFVRGEGGGNFSIVLPRDFPVSVGAAVRLPGFSAAYLGRVSDIDSPPNEPTKTARFSFSFNMRDLVRVVVDKDISDDAYEQ